MVAVILPFISRFVPVFKCNTTSSNEFLLLSDVCSSCISRVMAVVACSILPTLAFFFNFTNRSMFFFFFSTIAGACFNIHLLPDIRDCVASKVVTTGMTSWGKDEDGGAHLMRAVAVFRKSWRLMTACHLLLSTLFLSTSWVSVSHEVKYRNVRAYSMLNLVQFIVLLRVCIL